MPRIRHVVNKVNRPAKDESLWPVVFAMIILAGFLVGTVLAYLRLDDPRWYANAWTWLIAAVLAMSGGFIALWPLGNRMVRRTMQLAIVVCAILHVVMFIVAVETDVFGWVQIIVASNDEDRPRPQRTIPEYQSWQMNRQQPQPDFERPVETQTPEPRPEPEVIERREDEVQRDPVRPQERPLPETERTIEPNVIRRPEQNTSAPRFSENSSKLSRQTNPVEQPVVEPVPVAEPRPSSESSAAVEPSQSAVDRRESSREANRSALAEQQTSEPRETESMARAARERAPQPDASRAPAFEQRVTQARELPRAVVPRVAQPAEAAETSPQATQPALASTPRRETTSPEVQRNQPEPEISSPTLVQSTPRRASEPTPANPAIAQTTQSIPQRQQRVTERPPAPVEAMAAASASNPSAAPQPATTTAMTRQATRAAEAARAPAEASSSAEPARVATNQVTRRTANTAPSASGSNATSPERQPTLAPSASSPAAVVEVAAATGSASDQSSRARPTVTSVNRQSGSEPSAATRSATASATDPSPRQNISQEATRRSQSDVPSLAQQSSVNTSVARSTQLAPAAASPVPIESTADNRSTQPTPAASTPATLAINRGTQGTVGRQNSRNLDQDAGAGQRPTTVASTSAARATSVQREPNGPALSPSERAQVPRTRAESDRASFVAQADAVELGAEAGQRHPEQIAANASASRTSAASDADRGAVTAARGQGDVDLGPTQVVSEDGSGRASGGGQPVPEVTATHHLAASQGQSSRSMAPSIAASAVSPVPVAPAGSASEQPAVLAPTEAATSARRSSTAATELAAGGPVAVETGEAAASADLIASENPSRRSATGLPEVTGEEAGRLNRTAIREPDRGTPADSVAAAVPGESNPTGTSGAPAGPSAEPVAVTRAATTGGGESADRHETAGPSFESPTEIAGGPIRSELVEAAIGEPRPGGGTQSPSRAASGPAPAVTTMAETVSVAASAESAGSENGLAAALQGAPRTREAGGVAGPASTVEAGAAEDRVVVDVAGQGAPGTTGNRRSRDSDIGPTIGDAQLTGGPGRLTRRPTAAGQNAADVAVPIPAAARAGQDGEIGLAGSSDANPMSRQAGGGLRVEIAALDGPGGLGERASVEVGINDRRAREDSMDIHVAAVRFPGKLTGGLPDVNTAVAMAAEPFRRRQLRNEGDREGGGGRPGPQTEDAIEMGLVFLSRSQLPDGRWQLAGWRNTDDQPQLASDTAATALALLAFQGAGYHHLDHKYADVVRKGLMFLVSHQVDGNLHIPMDDYSNQSVALYGHGIAALALCEAYGMTQDPDLKQPAQDALDYIVASQDDERGGWRYTPKLSSDTSVTGWMMMALKSGELAGLEVPDSTYEKIRSWLDDAQASEPHLYRYNPYAPESQIQGREPTKTMTAVGLLMRLYSGWDRGNRNLRAGADHLAANLPTHGSSRNPQRDTYYWYYATQVMFHMGGDHWSQWNGQLHPLLLASQIQNGNLAGSWDPGGRIPDRWGPHGGRLYVTTLNLLSLEVYYRHLPLYQDTAGDRPD